METLELAPMEDLELCYGILDSARRFQREQGFHQWTDDYPSPETVRDDILRGKGYVVRIDGEIAAYMCIDFDGEPAYDTIEGAWHAEQPYAVVHRMGFSERFRNRGLAGTAFRLIEELCREKGVPYIRIDTHFPNKRMQHILERNGFVGCGVIRYEGEGRLAYDKLLK